MIISRFFWSNLNSFYFGQTWGRPYLLHEDTRPVKKNLLGGKPSGLQRRAARLGPEPEGEARFPYKNIMITGEPCAQTIKRQTGGQLIPELRPVAVKPGATQATSLGLTSQGHPGSHQGWQFYPRVRVPTGIRPDGRGYSHKILPAGMCMGIKFTRGYPMGTRNTKNNLVISYPSQILCLIFLCLYELNRRTVRMCELIDVKMILIFC